MRGSRPIDEPVSVAFIAEGRARSQALLRSMFGLRASHAARLGCMAGAVRRGTPAFCLFGGHLAFAPSVRSWPRAAMTVGFPHHQF